MIFALLRRLHHGPLRFLGPVWVSGGIAFRKIMSRSGLYVSHFIGDYGPFELDICFAFSNFSDWGSNKTNDGFAACINVCRGRHCVLDIGAHIGLVSLPIASVLGSGGKVVSFEPGKANRALLTRHVLRNGFKDKVVIEDVLVVSCSAQGIPFFEYNEPSGMNSVAGSTVGKNYSPVHKRQVSLDHFCATNDLLPEVIKIDVEGAEIDVLKGASAIIRKARPVIFLSFHPKHVIGMGFSAKDLTDLLTEYDYDWKQIDGSEVKEFSSREYILTPKA